MAACNADCSTDKPVQSQAEKDRVEYKVQAEVQEVKEDVKEEVIPELVSMLGEKLVSKNGNIDTKDLLQKDVIGLYFSAHWCPPCRRFTPQLAGVYNEMKKLGKSFEIVFISSDRSPENFQEYYKIMPWVALPFADRETKGKLSKKFDVQGIPRLLLLDPKTGEVTNPRANQDVVSDPSGKKFPWYNPHAGTVFEHIIDATFISNTGDEVALKDMDQKFFVLFFHSDKDDSQFLSTMTEWYNKFYSKLQGSNRSFEILYMGFGYDQDSFEKSFGKMPWAALSFKEKEKKNMLRQFLRVGNFPHVTTIEAKSGSIIAHNVVGDIGNEKSDETSFPWPEPKPCCDVNVDPQALNNYPCFVLWLEDQTKEKQTEDIRILTALAKGYVEPNGDREFGFLYVKQSGDMSGRLRSIIKEADRKDGFTLVDFGSRAKYNGDNYSVENLKSVMSKFAAKSLEMVKFQ